MTPAGRAQPFAISNEKLIPMASNAARIAASSVGNTSRPSSNAATTPWRHVRGLRKLAWRPFQNVAGLSALVGAHSLSSTVWARAACRCLTGASVGPRARVRLPYDADKLFNRVGIGRRLDSIDRFHQVARRLVNGSSCLATTAEPSEQPALRRFAPSCRPILLTHSPLACATLSTCLRRRWRFCSPRFGHQALRLMRLTQWLRRLSLIGKMQIAEWPQSPKSLRARLPAEYLGRGTINGHRARQ